MEYGNNFRLYQSAVASYFWDEGHNVNDEAGFWK